MHKLSLDQSAPETTEMAHSTQPVSHVDNLPQTSNTDASHHYSSINHSTPMKKPSKVAVILMSLFAVAAGVGTGFGGYKLQAKSGISGGMADTNLQQVATGTIKNGDVFGVTDEKTFKDSAEGYLEAGGLEGEGSHRLVRAGGESQTVYLTSSVTDLDKFVGMQVKVWGETFKGQTAGWLMDVGRVQVVDTQGEPPVEE